MNTKLTLSLEKTVIERAKLYAKQTGKSLSDLIENYLDNVTKNNESEVVSKKLNKIIGAVKLPKSFNEEKELRTYFEEKHL